MAEQEYTEFNPEKESLGDLLERFREERPLLDKILDIPSDIYYFLGGRHINNLKSEIKQLYTAIRNYKDGFGFIRDNEIWNVNDTISFFASKRLRLLKHKIITGKTCCDWNWIIQAIEDKEMAWLQPICLAEECLYSSAEEEFKPFLDVLDKIIFALEYDKFDVWYTIGEEVKIRKFANNSDSESVRAELTNQFVSRRDEGLELFGKYLPYLWD